MTGAQTSDRRMFVHISPDGKCDQGWYTLTLKMSRLYRTGSTVHGNEFLTSGVQYKTFTILLFHTVHR